jgi:hypothetical protein
VVRPVYGSLGTKGLNIIEINNTVHRICTTALFYILAPTCFGGSLPSSGSFWIRLSYVKIQIDMVVYHTVLFKRAVCRSDTQAT